jgi:hypothetical protein
MALKPSRPQASARSEILTSVFPCIMGVICSHYGTKAGYAQVDELACLMNATAACSRRSEVTTCWPLQADIL